MKRIYLGLILPVLVISCEKESSESKIKPEIIVESTVSDVSVYGATDGAIDITVSGGQPPYTYNWSDGNSGEDRNNLSAGIYQLTVEDADGSSKNITDTIEAPPVTVTSDELLQYIVGYTQSSIRIDDNGTVIYLDPAFVGDRTGDADIILTSHNHGDHIGSDDLCNSNTVYVSPANCKDNYSNTTEANFHLAVEGASFSIGNINVEVVAAYNDWHVRGEMMGVGYVITLSNGVKLYFMGDTDLIPEMSSIDCNAVFVPLGPTYTMSSVENAAAAVENCKAEIAIPIHYGMNEGEANDVVTLTNLLSPKNIEVLDLPRN